jgi:hypothetical protein
MSALPPKADIFCQVGAWAIMRVETEPSKDAISPKDPLRIRGH